MARVLIIDDDELVRAALVLLLERDGHEVSEACDGIDAGRILRVHIPDLVITDIVMPEMEGFQVIRKIRKVSPGLKIIAISGAATIGSQDILGLASKLGADRTFAKPIDRQEFLSSISRLLAAT